MKTIFSYFSITTYAENIHKIFKIFVFIMPHMNFPYKTSIDEQLIFYNITRCYSNGEYCHVFAIAAGDIIIYQGSHIMRKRNRGRHMLWLL